MIMERKSGGGFDVNPLQNEEKQSRFGNYHKVSHHPFDADWTKCVTDSGSPPSVFVRLIVRSHDIINHSSATWLELLIFADHM